MVYASHACTRTKYAHTHSGAVGPEQDAFGGSGATMPGPFFVFCIFLCGDRDRGAHRSIDRSIDPFLDKGGDGNTTRLLPFPPYTPTHPPAQSNRSRPSTHLISIHQTRIRISITYTHTFQPTPDPLIQFTGAHPPPREPPPPALPPPARLAQAAADNDKRRRCVCTCCMQAAHTHRGLVVGGCVVGCSCSLHSISPLLCQRHTHPTPSDDATTRLGAAFSLALGPSSAAPAASKATTHVTLFWSVPRFPLQNHLAPASHNPSTQRPTNHQSTTGASTGRPPGAP